MIIKLYTTPNNQSEIELRIYDNVSNVVVCPAERLEITPNFGEAEFFDHAHPFYSGSNCNSYYIVKPIKCHVGDEYKIIYVTNWAYICTDDGKTIEKVFVDNPELVKLG